MEEGQAPRKRILIATVLLVIVVGVLLVLSDLGEISLAIEEADWQPLLWALLFSVLSYLFISYSFALLSRALGVKMKRLDLAEIFFVTSVLNHIVSTGGVAGLSIRSLAMNRHGVPVRTTVTLSVLHFYLASLDMLLTLPVGAAYLLFNAHLSNIAMVLVGLLTVLLGCVALVSTLLIFVASLRQWVLQAVGRVTEFITRRDFSANLKRFERSMQDGVQGMTNKPFSVAAVVLLTAFDWICSVFALGFCFQAFGPPVDPGALVTGFVLGIMAGVVSMVPGGFGVQEGSMTGVYALLGVPLAQAVLAALAFRAVHFLLPYLASLPLYWRMLRRTAPQSSLAEGEPAKW